MENENIFAEVTLDHFVKGTRLICTDMLEYGTYFTTGKTYEIIRVTGGDANKSLIAWTLDDDNDIGNLFDVYYMHLNEDVSFTPYNSYTEEQQFIYELGGLTALKEDLKR